MPPFHLPADYSENPQNSYHDDVELFVSTTMHQPDVYAAAQYFLTASGRSTIVDLGCGNARKLLDTDAKRRIGVDFGPNIAWCRDRHGGMAEWCEVDFSRPDCRSAAAMTGDDTVVVCADVIEHLADPRPLLGLLADCRHRGALVITSTPDRVRVRGADHKGPPPNQSHVREWALDEYVALLADHDLSCTYAGYTINNTAHRELKTIVTIHDRSVERVRTSPDVAPPPVAILAAYNEADVIQEVAEDLLAQGCDLVLIDNWSDDGTWEAMSALSQRHPARVQTERFPAGGPASHYEWRNILRRKEEIAAGFPGRWILHTDADKVRRSPFAGTNLAEGLAIAQRCRANRVGFNLVNLRPVDDRPFVPGTLAHHFGHFEFGSRPGHFMQAKAWLQGTHRVDLASSGGHTVAFPGARDFPYKFLLQHYPIRSREHGRRKVLMERHGRWSPYERETLKWHSQYDGFSSDSPFTWSADGLHRFDESFFREHGLLIMTDILEKRLSGEFGHSCAPS